MGDMADDARDREEQAWLNYNLHLQGVCGGGEDCPWCAEIQTDEHWEPTEPEPINRRIEICEMVALDMKSDAAEFDGKPFNGRTVAEYFGNQGAAIAALADIIKSILEEK